MLRIPSLLQCLSNSNDGLTWFGVLFPAKHPMPTPCGMTDPDHAMLSAPLTIKMITPRIMFVLQSGALNHIDIINDVHDVSILIAVVLTARPFDVLGGLCCCGCDHGDGGRPLQNKDDDGGKDRNDEVAGTVGCLSLHDAVMLMSMVVSMVVSVSM